MSQTYVIFSNSGLNVGPMKIFLANYGLYPNQSRHITKATFVWTDGISVPTWLYSIQCKLSNHLQHHECISDKFQLSLNPKIAEWVSPSADCDDLESVAKLKFPLIIRPNLGFQGRGISIIDSIDQLDAAIALAKSETKGDTKILASEYITNVALYDGKKFHFRIYFLISIIKGKIDYSVCPLGEVFTAKYEYDSASRDKNYTDTHGKSTKGNIFLDDLQQGLGTEVYAKVLTNVKHVCAILTDIAKDKIDTYSESESGFELFACDFMLTANYNLILIEVNTKVGFDISKNPEITKKVSFEIFKWININVFDRVFK